MIYTSAITTDLLPALNAAGAADLTWWTTDELYAWMDEAAEQLGRTAGVFMARDTSATVPGDSMYTLPERCLSILAVALAGRALRPASAAELEARDTNWRNTLATADSPVRFWARDVAGMGTVFLAPVPIGIEALEVLHHTWPDTITGWSAIDAPAVLADFLYFSAIAGARAKQGQAAMPEVAEHAGQRAGIYTDLFSRYFGGAA